MSHSRRFFDAIPDGRLSLFLAGLLGISVLLSASRPVARARTESVSAPRIWTSSQRQTARGALEFADAIVRTAATRARSPSDVEKQLESSTRARRINAGRFTLFRTLPELSSTVSDVTLITTETEAETIVDIRVDIATETTDLTAYRRLLVKSHPEVVHVNDHGTWFMN